MDFSTLKIGLRYKVTLHSEYTFSGIFINRQEDLHDEILGTFIEEVEGATIRHYLRAEEEYINDCTIKSWELLKR